MNVLLFLPGLLLCLSKSEGIFKTGVYMVFGVVVQVLLAIPFYEFYHEYMERAFEFGRVFSLKFSMNWKFLGKKYFEDPNAYTYIFVAHVLLLLYFLFTKWIR
jgi:alpha-1,3-mannosyltransferase